jgi:hypothetical protein
MSRSPLVPWVFASLAVLSSQTLSAQVLAEKELPSPSSTLKDGLKSVTSLRELSDGRVLVVDSVGERLVLADLATGKVETKMKAGTEEDEFRVLSPLWAWPGGRRRSGNGSAHDFQARWDASTYRALWWGRSAWRNAWRDARRESRQRGSGRTRWRRCAGRWTRSAGTDHSVPLRH